tara:strand:- start:110 stop:679 length:570 start_codon:yes stop_codon:yes gene_type:complete
MKYNKYIMPRQPKTKNAISTVDISEEVKQEQTVLENKPLANEVVPIEQGLDAHFANIYLMLTGLKQAISGLNLHLKILEKDMKKQLKNIEKTNKKPKTKGNRKPSGFAKPSDVSNELCKFMGRDTGTQIARTEVTQYLIQYIKENQLQFAENKKIILPDEKLKKLLGVDNTTEVTYFNLQGLMNKHFVH